MNSNSKVLNESEIEELRKVLSKMGQWVILAEDVPHLESREQSGKSLSRASSASQ